MATPLASFGALLRRHRLAAGLTQEALAERSGLTARGIQRLERGGRTSPRAETVRLLADALGLDAAARAAFITAAHPELMAPPPPSALSPRLPALPVPPTPLVGREREVADACALLRDPDVRLLTLTGPGGVGKTRLALAIAGALAADFADGVAWVELASLRNRDLVPSAIAHALGVREGGGQPPEELLARAVAERRFLLVLDNCEHLLPAMSLVGALLAAAQHLVVLATSRARLRLRGEREAPIESLAVPATADELPSLLVGVAAVRLFVERAAAAEPGFALTVENSAAVAAICRRLDGLPLAIELASARVKLLPPPVLLARLERRLPLLSGGPRDAPIRQQTMRDAIAWSHDLLTEEEQRLFRRLAVFAGGFTLEAAEWVAGPDALEGLAGLLDQSLLRSHVQPIGESRFAMLETVHEYALERLEASDEVAAIRQAHAAFVLSLAEQGEPELTGPQQTQWLNRLEAEHDNLRAALGWAIAQDAPTALGVRLAGALWRFWWMRGHYREGRSWLEAALAQNAGAEAEHAKALYGAGSLATEQGDYEQAARQLEAALAAASAAGEPAVAALALTDLGSIARQQGAYERAAQFHGEALALRRESGDHRGIAVSQANLGFASLFQRDFERAEALLSDAAMAFRELGDWHSLITMTSNLALAAVMRGDNARARAMAEESLASYQAMGDRQGMADDLVTLGLAMRGEGEPVRAAALFGEALDHCRDIGYQVGEAIALHHLGITALNAGEIEQALTLLGDSLRLVRSTGDLEEMAGILGEVARAAALVSPERAAGLFGAASALRQTHGASRPSAEQALHERAVAAVRRVLGEQTFAAAFATGAALPLEHAISEALAICEGRA